MPDAGTVERCDRCGRRLVAGTDRAARHEAACAKQADTPFDGSVCPNCGEEYDGYMDHITDCYDGRGTGDE